MPSVLKTSIHTGAKRMTHKRLLEWIHFAASTHAKKYMSSVKTFPPMSSSIMQYLCSNYWGVDHHHHGGWQEAAQTAQTATTTTTTTTTFSPSTTPRKTPQLPKRWNPAATQGRAGPPIVKSSGFLGFHQLHSNIKPELRGSHLCTQGCL